MVLNCHYSNDLMKILQKKFFFRETPTSPWAQFRAKCWPLVQLFHQNRPLGLALVLARGCHGYYSWMVVLFIELPTLLMYWPMVAMVITVGWWWCLLSYLPCWCGCHGYYSWMELVFSYLPCWYTGLWLQWLLQLDGGGVYRVTYLAGVLAHGCHDYYSWLVVVFIELPTLLVYWPVVAMIITVGWWWCLWSYLRCWCTGPWLPWLLQLVGGGVYRVTYPVGVLAGGCHDYYSWMVVVFIVTYLVGVLAHGCHGYYSWMVVVFIKWLTLLVYWPMVAMIITVDGGGVYTVTYLVGVLAHGCHDYYSGWWWCLYSDLPCWCTGPWLPWLLQWMVVVFIEWPILLVY